MHTANKINKHTHKHTAKWKSSEKNTHNSFPLLLPLTRKHRPPSHTRTLINATIMMCKSLKGNKFKWDFIEFPLFPVLALLFSTHRLPPHTSNLLDKSLFPLSSCFDVYVSLSFSIFFSLFICCCFFSISIFDALLILFFLFFFFMKSNFAENRFFSFSFLFHSQFVRLYVIFIFSLDLICYYFLLCISEHKRKKKKSTERKNKLFAKQMFSLQAKFIIIRNLIY